MKTGIKISVCPAILLLLAIASPLARAQNSQQAEASPTADNAVTSPALPLEIVSNAPLGQIVQMLQSGAAKNAILADIAKSTDPFNVNAAGLGYLNDLGAPSDIEIALIQRDRELGVSAAAQSANPAPTGQTPDSQDVTEDYFYGALASYGMWTNVPGYGFCWQPYAVNYNPGWTPYCTLGQWIYTDSGWYWLSGYSWGWSVFHYGRWFHDASRGWCWWPSTTWAPSWVFWRYSGRYCGWAPLPPHCYYSEETGLMYNGAAITSSYDFGIGANVFNFVPMADLFDSNVERFRLPAAPSAQLFAQSQVLTAINSNDRIIVNDGIPLSTIAAATHGRIRSLTIQPVESVALPGARGDQVLPDGETLAINRPYFVNAPSALQGVKPVPAQEQPVPHQGTIFIFNENPLNYSPASSPENSVIYVDSAAQNAETFPTVTLAGPQDYFAPGPCPVEPGPSYWSVSAEAPVPVDTAPAYSSPRHRAHEHSEHHVPPPDDRRDFDPPVEGSWSSVHREDHSAKPEQRNSKAPHPSPASTAVSPNFDSPVSHTPAAAAPNSSPHDQKHGR